MNNFNYYNRNLYDVTGSHLTETLIELAEDERWQNKDTYYFYNFFPTHVSDQSLDPENSCFKLIAQPTHNQPGSGRIYFHGEDPSWKDLEEFVQDSAFREIWKNYKSNELKGKDFTDPNDQACVLLSYEIARRVKVDPELYPVTREQTIEAIDKVMSTTGGEYPNMVRYSTI